MKKIELKLSSIIIALIIIFAIIATLLFVNFLSKNPDNDILSNVTTNHIESLTMETTSNTTTTETTKTTISDNEENNVIDNDWNYQTTTSENEVNNILDNDWD